MINALDHLLKFYKKYLVNIILARQNNLSACFAPKYGPNGLREMPTIPHQWGIKLLWKHNIVGGWFIHLTIFEENYKAKKILACQNDHSFYFALCQKMSSLKFDKYWKSGSNGLGKMPAISYLRERNLLLGNHNTGGWLMH